MKLHAGRKADERPTWFQLDDRDQLVEEVTFFTVRADDRNIYILRRNTPTNGL